MVVGVVKRDQRVAKSCYATAADEAMQMTLLDVKRDLKKRKEESIEELEEVLVKPDARKKKVKLKSNVSEDVRRSLLKCLRAHADAFA